MLFVKTRLRSTTTSQILHSHSPLSISYSSSTTLSLLSEVSLTTLFSSTWTRAYEKTRTFIYSVPGSMCRMTSGLGTVTGGHSPKFPISNSTMITIAMTTVANSSQFIWDSTRHTTFTKEKWVMSSPWWQSLEVCTRPYLRSVQLSCHSLLKKYSCLIWFAGYTRFGSMTGNSMITI
jgi:hypothetical protein